MVTLYLPRSRADVSAERETDNADVAGGEGEVVLIVEDNLDVAEMSAGLIEQLGYRVMVANNAEQALAAIAESPDIALVFSDIVMAGSMDGIALAKAIRERKPSMPILLTTGYSKAADGVGVDFPVLRKPYEVGDLARAFANVRAIAAGAVTSNLIKFPRPPRA